MGLQYHKRVSLGSKTKLNIGRKSGSFTFGGKGHSLNLGSRGAYLNLGIPGTGFRYRMKLSGKSKSNYTKPIGPLSFKMWCMSRPSSLGCLGSLIIKPSAYFLLISGIFVGIISAIIFIVFLWTWDSSIFGNNIEAYFGLLGTGIICFLILRWRRNILKKKWQECHGMLN